MIPDYCEPILAYRCWDVCENGLLCGQAIPEPWPPYHAVEAACRVMANTYAPAYSREPHLTVEGVWLPAPVRLCNCGFHAYKTLEQAEARVRTDHMPSSWGSRPARRAWGAVALWGTLIEHTEGYRAQFAYPWEVHCTDEKLAGRIAELYSVPCSARHIKSLKDEENRAVLDAATAGYSAWSSAQRFFFSSPSPSKYVKWVTYNQLPATPPVKEK